MPGELLLDQTLPALVPGTFIGLDDNLASPRTLSRLSGEP